MPSPLESTCRSVGVVIIQDTNDGDLGDVLQKMGRAGRNREMVADPRGIVYVPRGSIKAAEKLLRDNRNSSKDTHWAQFLVADCKINAINSAYKNPTADSACWCNSCLDTPPASRPEHCHCSGCMPATPPEPVDAPIAQTAPSTSESSPPTIPTSQHQVKAPKQLRLSRDMRNYALPRFAMLRLRFWRAADQKTVWMLAPDNFLPDRLASEILDRYYLLTTKDALRLLLKPHKHVLPHLDTLWDELQRMGLCFEHMCQEKKAAKAAKAKAKRDAARARYYKT
ncbi:hypothetical protein HGRIS_011091 [Hohenbuehelia grisea]|uniref:Uncharacterized protein n=1 Tax=Hohenbuehelia grisea TaxID=104357 RepID=A0ABR3IYY1_9AGAR